MNNPPGSPRVLVVRRFSEATEGGVQRVTDGLVDSLAERGHDVTYAREGDRLEQTAPGRWTVPLETPYSFRSLLKPSQARRVGGALRAAYKLLRATRPDVVVFVYVTFPALYFLALRPLFGYRLYLMGRGSDVLTKRGRSDRLTRRPLLRRADGVAAISEPVAAAMRDAAGHPDRDVEVIHNGTDLAFWNEVADVERSGGDAPTFVSVGTLRPIKGHAVLVDAFARVHADFPRARLVFVGDGSLREALGDQAEALGIGGVVSFAGHLERPALRERLARSDVFVLPSHNEGFGLALLESMAAGLACVGSDVGGVPDLLGGGAGVLVPPGDPAALAEALSALAGDPARRRALGARARARAQAFGWQEMVTKYEAFLELTTAKQR